MPPFPRTGPYRTPHRTGRWLATALPWLFVIAVVAATMLPVRDWVRGLWIHSYGTQAEREWSTLGTGRQSALV